MMRMMSFSIFAVLFALAGLAAGHACIWHPSMYGFNVTDQTFPYDNRPVSPLMDMSFDQWWFHGHLDHPPNDGDMFNLAAGQTATTEIACNKGATTWFNSSEGGDIRDPNNPNDVCPGSPMSEYHTTGFDDLTGCALAIAYKNDARDVKPEDFTVFSVNQTCVWTRFTDFQVPERMPPCPEGGCTCAFFWIHSPDSGGEQNYMNGFKCNVTGSTSDVPLAKPQIPRRCGSDPSFNRQNSIPANCTYGAKQPFYWFQKEVNNMFEGTFAPPFYTDLYNFIDGAQDDIFQDSYESLPDPSPVATLPVLANLGNIIGSSLGNSINSTTSNPSNPSDSGGILGVLRANGIKVAALRKRNTNTDPTVTVNGTTPADAIAMQGTGSSGVIIVKNATSFGSASKRLKTMTTRRNTVPLPLPLRVKKSHSSPSSGFIPGAVSLTATTNDDGDEDEGSPIHGQVQTQTQVRAQGRKEVVEEGWMRSRIARQSGHKKTKHGVRINW
ncbi:hypothetical protein K435DRAFT_784205 [Dendrothele bispora CBS 962.96]|uniref:Lytic polysaccharide monooxygenase n=1 Tax=Dendrothele bispora (strain CBS 962.96) TaxID=1314807 RepID=A0A4S8L4A2_DENBC|nr:hypothetical protein K435DRAFT_784205 [Dendrothele bispora CBS 962.96]